MMGDHNVTLAEQLSSATDLNACFCFACGQPDEPSLHDPARCPANGGERDPFMVSDALSVFDRSCEEEPDLRDEPRALHCAIVAGRAALPKEGEEAIIEILARLEEVHGNKAGAFTLRKVGILGTVFEQRAAVLREALSYLAAQVKEGRR